MIYDDQEARARRIVKVALLCMAIAIVIALAQAASAQAASAQIGPLESWLPCPAQAELPPGAVCVEPPPTDDRAPGGKIIDPVIECAPGASCYYAFAPVVKK